MSILFRLLLTTTLFLILSYGIWALHIKCLYLKVFTLTVCSTMVIFGHLLGKKVLFGIGTRSLKWTQIHYKNPWPVGVAVAENWKVCQPIKNLSGHLCIRNNMKSTQLTSSISLNPSSSWIEVMEPIRNKCDHHWWHICQNNINVCCKPRVLHRYKIPWEKEEIRLSPMTKAHTPTEMSNGQNDNTNNAKKVRLHSGCGLTYDGQLK